MSEKLLSREEFREKVLQRDHWQCIGQKILQAKGTAKSKCEEELQELQVHHIYDRKLYSDGGYYLSNGVSVCAVHHYDAELGTISVQDFEQYLQVSIRRPDILSQFERYNKWGTEILFDWDEHGIEYQMGDKRWMELRTSKEGEASVQTKYKKYPRTYHLPWSPGLQNDDRRIESLDHLRGCLDIVVTEKMDGENTTLYDDALHARSLSSGYHPSRGMAKKQQQEIAHDIPADFRICGENMYAEHSIHYDNLEAYFLVFNIWQGSHCLSWDDTLDWADLLGLKTVRVLYRGAWDQTWFDNFKIEPGVEGYVVRDAASFPEESFSTHVAKYVRKGHVQTDEHWMKKQVVPNGLGTSN